MTATAGISALIPYAHVQNVEQSIAFYGRLGFAIESRWERDGRLDWAMVRCGDARLMLARAGEPIDATRQGVLFCFWTGDVSALRSSLLAAGVPVGEIRHPDHMPAGEIRLEDPDGYVLLIGQLGEDIR